MPLLSDRTKVVRGVLSFLALCAVVGFITGLRGALPAGVYEEEGPVATTPSGVVVEAAPAEAPAIVEEEKAEEEEAEEEKTDEPAPAAAATEQPKTDAAPAAQPREEAPPADPVGDLIEPPAPTPPPDIY